MTEELMKDYKLNTYIEWTEEDRKRGECPVPDGSEVTVWFEGGGVNMSEPRNLDWGEYFEGGYFTDNIIGYMIHSIPREPREWYLVKGLSNKQYTYKSREDAQIFIDAMMTPENWEIIKVREVMEEDA